MNSAAGEQLRQQYLASMGITSWLPTQSLPGAAPSPSWCWRALDEGRDEGLDDGSVNSSSPSVRSVTAAPTAAASSEAFTQCVPRSGPDVSTASKRPVAAIQQLLGQAEAIEGPAAVKENVEPALPPRARAAESARAADVEPRFRLAFVGYDDCLVVNELPLDVMQGFTAIHQTLLERILTSVKLGSGNPRVQLFAWPVVSSIQVDQSYPVARAGVGKMIARFKLNKDSPLILLGAQAEHFARPASLQNTIGDPVCAEGRAILAAASLNELMRVPGLKRELWQRLLQLQRLL